MDAIEKNSISDVDFLPRFERLYQYPARDSLVGVSAQPGRNDQFPGTGSY